MTTSMPFLDVRRVGEARVIEFTRHDLTDGAFIKQAGDEIYHLVRRLEQPRVVIDFARVERLSSATLGMIVALRKVVVDQQKGQLRIANVAENLKDIFRMTKLDKVVKICDGIDEAIESFE